VKNRLFAANVKKSEHSLKLNELKRYLDKVIKEHDSIGRDKKMIEKNLQQIDDKIRQLDAKIQESDDLSNKIEGEKQILIEKSQDIEKEIKDKTVLLNEKKMEAVANKERFSSIEAGVEQLNSQIAATESEIDILRHVKGSKNLAEIEQQIAVLKKELDFGKKRKLEIEAKLPEKLIENLTHRLNEIFDKLAAKQKTHEDLQNRVMQFKYESFQLNHRKDEAWKKGDEEFKIDLRDYEPEEDIPNAEQRLAEIKGKLEKLGEVNPLSLDLYEHEKKRLDEFLGQRDDIITAKSSLLHSIEELDTRARERFVAIFDKVKQEFDFVFSKFFEGGHADLRLSDPNNPLTSKVDIVVRMKGKRLKIINQLSGGERTLLAVSLLLALYLVKPAPFCILDEIDAPLDDANVVRFNRFLRDLSQRTQVVIITHNRATMEYADYLYGLTMEKPGQSKIISAKLADLEKLNLDA
jgi:chromosome segregation protein